MYKQIYNKILARPIIALSILQLLLILIVYNKFIFSPNDYMFTNMYDGLKNYFTFFQFVTQDASALGPWHFTEMNYPFGEYIFFSDNTPGLALPLRFIHQNIINLEGHLIGIHNYFFLFNLFLTPILFFLFIKPFTSKHVGMALFFSIAISWTNPQLLKLFHGVYNLSLTSLLLLALLLMRSIYYLWESYSQRRLITICIQLFLLIFCSAFFHIYYIPILALAIGVFTLVVFCYEWYRKKNFKPLSLFGIALSTAMGGLCFYALVQSIDTYSDFRKARASGFSWIEWNFTPEAIFTPQAYNSIYPLIKSCKASLEIPSESQGFWGNFVWFTLFFSFTLLVFFLAKKKISMKELYAKAIQSEFFFALFITMFFTYAAASGLYVKLCVVPLSFDNVFSPFYFLHDKVDLITQFRCLGRFSWIGFWIMFFLTLMLFFKTYQFLLKENLGVARTYAFILLFFMCWDAKDSMIYQSKIFPTNVFKKEILDEKFEGLNNIDFQEYQAILTIPAVQVGSEDYNITIDDQYRWTRYWMQLSVYSRLPLFNCKMSRTALNQAHAQIDLFLDKAVPELIYEKVNDKPVLVVYSKENEDNFDLNVLEYALPAVKNASLIIQAFEMDTLFELNNIYYLSWDIKNKN